jgi:NAD(P)-dependent dehydrogenase (short-subunit alcohol dehydrogenase family)
MSEQRIVVVTGGASGIGLATVAKLAARGDMVVIADLADGPGREVAARFAEEGRAVRFVPVDVADDASVAAHVEEVCLTIGVPFGLVTCAGILESPRVSWLADIERHDAVWRVNYRGTFMTIRGFGPRMIEARRGGAVVTVGSINSFRPLPLPAYNPAKVAIKGLTEMLAVEYGAHRIRVNGVAPTFTMTPPLLAKIEAGERDETAIRQAHALDMRVMPDHIADGILFLLSDQSAAITGHMLPIDAGWLAAQTYRHFVGPIDGYQGF